MSAYLEKERLLEWLNYRAKGNNFLGDNTSNMDEVFPAYEHAKEDLIIIKEIKSGKFDWQPND